MQKLINLRNKILLILIITVNTCTPTSHTIRLKLDLEIKKQRYEKPKKQIKKNKMYICESATENDNAKQLHRRRNPKLH